MKKKAVGIISKVIFGINSKYYREVTTGIVINILKAVVIVALATLVYLYFPEICLLFKPFKV